jgi:phosphatidylinositol alpha 1,6-mannosyltransferase
MRQTTRVALFADTFYEVNGAARTCREWAAYAERTAAPLFVVRCGGNAGELPGVSIARGRLSVPVDADLRFDPLFYRRLARIEGPLREFKPDVIHLTSPGDLGILGAILAAKLRVPLALSWHTNLHEFAARRAALALAWLPPEIGRAACARIERFVRGRVVWFFGRGDVLFAPNPELVRLLHEHTGKPVFPMTRGVDTRLFTPGLRDTRSDNVVIGYAGRLTPEKNVRFLARLAGQLAGQGIRNVEFLVAGGGGERPWLERALPAARFTGVLTGAALARAYASMDIFAFPSRTDTFGNVVQEAMACGVPAVVTDSGGPRYIVKHGVTGWVAENDDRFCDYVRQLAVNQAMRRRMAIAARQQMTGCSWDAVFDAVYRGYRNVLGGVRSEPETVAVKTTYRLKPVESLATESRIAAEAA